MAVIAGVDMGDHVVEFPWVRKWALMCIDVASTQGPDKVDAICELLTDNEKVRVRDAIIEFRNSVSLNGIAG